MTRVPLLTAGNAAHDRRFDQLCAVQLFAMASSLRDSRPAVLISSMVSSPQPRKHRLTEVNLTHCLRASHHADHDIRILCGISGRIGDVPTPKASALLLVRSQTKT